MLLRKFSNAIIKQDWNAILVEVLIVALGIYLGVQANNWQEQQKDIAKEHQLLSRLKEDLQNLQRSNIQVIDIYQQQLKRYDQVIKFASQQKSWKKPYNEWQSLIQPLMGYPDPVTKLPVYDEILATAKLGLIQNDKLRVELTRLNQLLESADATNRDVLRLYSEGYKKLFNLLVDIKQYPETAHTIYNKRDRRDIVRHLYLMKRSIEVVKIFITRINDKTNKLLALIEL